jgi:thioesterase domain-containing protein
MRASYPQGPCLIGGASCGGLVAFETAKQLRAQGAEPAFLLLFDTSVPGSEEILETKHKLARFGKNLREPYVGTFAEMLKTILPQ